MTHGDLPCLGCYLPSHKRGAVGLPISWLGGMLGSTHGQALFHLPNDPLSIGSFLLTTALVSASILSPLDTALPILASPSFPLLSPCLGLALPSREGSPRLKIWLTPSAAGEGGGGAGAGAAGRGLRCARAWSAPCRRAAPASSASPGGGGDPGPPSCRGRGGLDSGMLRATHQLIPQQIGHYTRIFIEM